MTEETLFHLAVQQPAAQRAAFLEKMCGDDHALRKRVEAHLLTHELSDSFHEKPTVEIATTVQGPRLTEEPGSRLGPYKLLQQIGEGGMGTVFMAEQQEPVRRMVALKFIKPGMDSQLIIARFMAERQALALMDHPNIAKVLDAGATATGRPYFVMELVKGVHITKYCDEHQLTPRQRLELFVPICRAVQHAHQKGVIHRDLKPSNVLVALYDGRPVPKVIDFGVAKATGSRLTDKTLFTEFGAVVGTVEYMSPEQAELDQLDIDTRSDIYALGVLLYELLTGTTPLDRPRIREKSILELLRIIREEEPPRPSTRLSSSQGLAAIAAKRSMEPKKLSGLVRGDLDWIVMQCLEKDRNRRYETANNLASEVERYLADEPVLACPPSATYRWRKFARRHRTGLGIAATAVAALWLALLGAGWGLWQRSERQAETSQTVQVALAKVEDWGHEAEGMPLRTSQEAEAALVVWRRAADALAQADNALNTGVAPESLRRQVQNARVQFETGRQRAEQRRLEALRKEKLLADLDDARMTRAALSEGQWDYGGASRKYAAAFAAYGLEVAEGDKEALAQRIGAEEATVRAALIVALDDWAFSARHAKQRPTVEELRALVDAVDNDVWRRRLRAAGDEQDRTALRELSVQARQSSLPASSSVLLAYQLWLLEQHEEAIDLLRWARGRYLKDFWIHFDLGCLLQAYKTRSPIDLEEAIGCYRAALALRTDARAAHNNLGVALRSKNLLDDAIAEFRQALEIDPKDARAHNNLGLALKNKNQLDEAIAEFHRALEIDPEDAAVHNNLGNVLRASDRLDKAIVEYRKALQLSPNYMLAHYNLGNALFFNNQLGEAIVHYQKAIAIDPKFALAHYGLGVALRDNNQLDAAIAAFRKAIEVDSKYAEAFCNLGDVLRRQGGFAEALTAFRRGHELGSQRPEWRYPSAEWVSRGQREAAMDEKLPNYLKGEFQPHNNDERLALAEVCRIKQHYGAAVTLFTDAFTSEPLLANRRTDLRYNAACCAALASAGQGHDADKLDDPQRTRLRQQALDWLRAGLNQYSKRLENAKTESRKAIQGTLQNWQNDTDLTALRDPKALEKLPANEQEAWRKLWADVADLLKNAGDAK